MFEVNTYIPIVCIQVFHNVKNNVVLAITTNKFVLKNFTQETYSL